MRPEPVRVIASDPRIAYIGAFDHSAAEGARFAWPHTQIRARFTGAWLRVDLTDTSAPDETPENDWLAVELDGEAQRPIRLKEGRRAYWLAANLSEGIHSLVLTKRTEPEVGTITFHGFELAPGGEFLEPPPPANRRMAVIGDSISAGYGVEGKRPSCRARAFNEDATRSYAAVAAKELAADLWLAAWSGKGISRNYEARDRDTMAQLFERPIPTDSPARHSALDRLPDVWVVHLGTNDFMGGIPEQEEFLASYRELLGKLSILAPEAAVVLVLSPLLTDQYPHPQARTTLSLWLTVLKAERAARGKDTIVVEQNLAAQEGFGCVAHPSEKSHARLGHELAQVLRARLGW